MRTQIILQGPEVEEDGEVKGRSCYHTTKNKRNTQEKLELKKYCKFHKKRVVFREKK